jgi:hypothetical protein
MGKKGRASSLPGQLIGGLFTLLFSMAVWLNTAYMYNGMEMWLAMPVWMAIGIPALGWAMVLLAFWVNPWCSTEFKRQAADRFLSTVHALVTGMLGLCVEVFTEPQCMARTTWVGALFLVFLGYLAVDLVSIIVCDLWKGWRPLDKPMLGHHVFILTFFTLGFVKDVGVWFGATLLINELSTPFVNIFWYLNYTGRKESQAFKVNGVFLLLAFFLFRIVYIPLNFWHFIASGLCQNSANSEYKHLSWLMVVGYASIYVLNLTWFSKILRGALKAVGKQDKKLSGTDAALLAEQSIALSASQT